MIWAIREVFSSVPENFGIKPFSISCSIKLLERRKTKIKFLREDVNILSGTDVSFIGWEVAGSMLSPLL